MEQTSDVLAGSRVLRFGKRQAVDACAAMLAAGGAEIIVAEEHEALPLDGVDIVIAALVIASPMARAALSALKTQAKVIVCDITAMGSAAGPSTLPYSDAQVQAITGLMDTTGFSAGPAHLKTQVYSGGVGWSVTPFINLSLAYYHGKRNSDNSLDQVANKLYVVTEYFLSKSTELIGLVEGERFNAFGTALDNGTPLRTGAGSSVQVGVGLEHRF